LAGNNLKIGLTDTMRA